VHIDNLARITSVAVPTLLGELLEMEIRGAVLQMSGKRFVKLDVNAYNG
jgi:predicted Rossmann fold nucleotide-binding protein DprA/Smf involved in DNA uptake